MEIDIGMIETLVAGGMAICAAVYAAYLKGKVSAATPATQVASPVAQAPATPALPTSTIFDPSQHGGKGPNFWTWEQMKKMVAFKVSDATKKNMLSGIEDPADRQEILDGIAKAEKTNEYQYTIGFTHGYYAMHAVCSPTGVNEYKYQVVVADGGLDKQ